MSDNTCKDFIEPVQEPDNGNKCVLRHCGNIERIKELEAELSAVRMVKNYWIKLLTTRLAEMGGAKMNNFTFEIVARPATQEELRINTFTGMAEYHDIVFDVYQCLEGHDTAFVCTCGTLEDAEKVGCKE
jgi:hypothetical protein